MCEWRYVSTKAFMLSPMPCEQFPCIVLLLFVSLYPFYLSFIHFAFICVLVSFLSVLYSHYHILTLCLFECEWRGQLSPSNFPHNSSQSQSPWRWLDSRISQCAQFTKCPGSLTWGWHGHGNAWPKGQIWPDWAKSFVLIGQNPHILIPIGPQLW